MCVYITAAGFETHSTVRHGYPSLVSKQPSPPPPPQPGSDRGHSVCLSRKRTAAEGLQGLFGPISLRGCHLPFLSTECRQIEQQEQGDETRSSSRSEGRKQKAEEQVGGVVHSYHHHHHHSPYERLAGYSCVGGQRGRQCCAAQSLIRQAWRDKDLSDSATV